MRKSVLLKTEVFNDAQELEIEPEVFVYRTKKGDALFSEPHKHFEDKYAQVRAVNTKIEELDGKR